ncbi:putative notchless, partial [Toxoplasma gondii p89]
IERQGSEGVEEL